MNRAAMRWVGVGAGLGVVVAAWMPWIVLDTFLGLSITRSGMAGNGDGIITATLGLAGAALAWRSGKFTAWFAAACGAAVVLVGALDAKNVNELAVEFNDAAFGVDDFVTPRVGMGLYLTIAAGVVLVVATVVAWAKRPAEVAAPDAPAAWEPPSMHVA